MKDFLARCKDKRLASTSSATFLDSKMEGSSLGPSPTRYRAILLRKFLKKILLRAKNLRAKNLRER